MSERTRYRLAGLGIVIIVVGFRHFRLHPDQNQRTWDRRRAAQQQVPS